MTLTIDCDEGRHELCSGGGTWPRRGPHEEYAYVCVCDCHRDPAHIEPTFDPAHTKTATNAADALELARAWADGRRSWINVVGYAFGSPSAHAERDQTVAVMDAQETVKWAAVAAAMSRVETDATFLEWLKREDDDA